MLIAIVWTCAVLGDVTSYTIGRRLGRAWLLRHGDRLKITEARLHQVEGFFEKRGGLTILIGRFIGLVRALAPFIAGTSRMPLRVFLPYDVIGAGAWATTFCVLGYVFWRSFDQLTQYVSRGLFAFGTVVVLGLGLYFLVRLRRDEELRAKVRAWMAEREGNPLVRLRAAARRADVALARAPRGGRRRRHRPLRSGPPHAGQPRPRADDADRVRCGGRVQRRAARARDRRGGGPADRPRGGPHRRRRALRAADVDRAGR